MNAKELLQQIVGLTLVVLLLTGCGPASTEPTLEAAAIPPTATPIPPTLTPIAPTATAIPPTATPVPPAATPIPPTATAVPTATAEAPSGLQPLSPGVCRDLADTMAQTLGVAAMTGEAPFQIGGRTGTGCQVTISGTGLDFENHMIVADAVRETLGSQGWEADFMMFAAEGPTGTGNAFVKGNALCLFSVGWEPSGDANCPSDKPIYECKLSPEQKLYTIMLNCAQDTSIEASQASQSEPEPMRIEFAPGDISAQVQGSLVGRGIARYVLTAMAHSARPVLDVQHEENCLSAHTSPPPSI